MTPKCAPVREPKPSGLTWMKCTTASIRNVLTRTTGYLKTVSSHSLQPYRGCTFGCSLCGVGCYVRHNVYLTQGRPWGEFLEIRENAADSYLANVKREAAWARRGGGRFGIFLSSSTEPFLPQEFRYGVTRGLLLAMLRVPPDVLVLQTHSHRVVEYVELYSELLKKVELRVHLSIETDREEMPGLPPHASSVEQRLEASRALKSAGVPVVVTVSPLLPIAAPARFFERIAEVADAVVVDHFIEGDGTPDGRRTRRTGLPEAMAALDPKALELDYRERMARVAERYLPGRVGISIDGFAGRWCAPGVAQRDA